VVRSAEWVVGELGMGVVPAGVVLAVAGVGILLLSLALMVANLKGALLKRVEGLFNKVFFRNDATSYLTGAVVTIMVQSSTITTSLIVPLAGAGTVKLKRVFPFVLGANLGTTATGLLAAAASPVAGAVTVAFAHVLFNVVGASIWYPLRIVPIRLAKRYAALAAERKRFALFYLVAVFMVVPVVGFVITEWLV
jgi:sodium-dependent phosphate cotransporter